MENKIDVLEYFVYDKNQEGEEMRRCLVCFILPLFLLFLSLGQSSASPDNTPKMKKSLSVFPILMYDTDIGVGYGGKAKFVHYLSRKESFDLIVFNSSKGERWYVFTFCIPDIEIRQGKIYPLSFDLKAEYNKFMKYSFYGLGADSREENETVYTFERKELQLKFGRGFTPYFVMEAHYVFKNVRYFNVEKSKIYTEILDGVGEQFSPYASLFFRYDTSDSQIHPKKGFRILLQNDLASDFLGNKKARFHRFVLDFRKYLLFFGSKDVLAFRVLVEKISGKKIPLFEMPVLGGGSERTAMRGYKLNRFIDKGKFLLNAEYRFPVWKKLGGNIFADAGCLWPSWSDIDIASAVVDIGWGLRYYLENFVVRFDMGFSQDGIGIYFNFGHIF